MFRLNMDADINGTSLQGYLKMRHENIVSKFGAGDDCGDKTTQEWMFESETGEVFTVYDYKTGYTPTGDYHWHIGGRRGTDVAGFIAWLTKQVSGASDGRLF